MNERTLPIFGSSVLTVIAIISTVWAWNSVVKGTRFSESRTIATNNPRPVTNVKPRITTSTVPNRPQGYYSVVTARPIFSPKRRPTEIVPAEQPIATIASTPPSEPLPKTPPPLRLMGIISSEQKAAALVSLADTEAMWVNVGDNLQDWEITEIGADWIKIKLHDQNLRLELYK